IQIPSKDNTVRPALPRAADPLPAAPMPDQGKEVAGPTQVSSPSDSAYAAAPTAVGELVRNKPKEGAKPKEDAKPAEATKRAEPRLAASEPVAKAVAPHASQQADDAARAKAILEGKTDAKTSKVAADSKPARFVVQVAALATREKINELQGKLKQAGIKSFTQKVATRSGERTRIRVGPFASKEEADKMRVKLVKLGLNGTLVPVS
ncbi:MAG TPA: hypothetical protein DIT28_09450, partial [Oxalobacteraceae bacterium]|nr:hypothetical protein [Oxalobacteraceae bacterium]